ncbi:MAG: GNAT family N-acetyltransferase [Actinobacteria bacterium]|nr:GNAT family N-acetyltransferase [Actinomycetota bacterium]
MSDSLIVRPAQAGEIDEVGRLTQRAYVTDGLVEPAGAYVAELGRAAQRARDAELLVAADREGRLLGTVTVCAPDSPLAEVSRSGELEFRMLAVSPEARRRGVGEELVTAVIQQAEDVGASRVVLCSAEHMSAAHRLYARMGFIRLPERDWYPAPDLLLLAFGRTREWHSVL